MTKEALRKHRKMIQDLRTETRQLIDAAEELRSRATRTTPSYSADPGGSGGACNDPFSGIIARLEEKDREIARLDLLRENIVSEIESAIKPLESPERFVIRAYYIECMEWDKVTRISNYSRSMVFKFHSDAIEKMNVRTHMDLVSC